MEATFKFEPTPDYWRMVEQLAKEFQRAQDDDGGMHVVGVQMLIGYEQGEYSLDDIMMPMML